MNVHNKLEKRKLEKLINKLQTQLENAQEQLENLDKNERWQPDMRETYYRVNGYNEVCTDNWADVIFDRKLYDTYNCFKTQEEAEKEANKILIRRKLEDVARRLNGDETVDWSIYTQREYYIYYDYDLEKLAQTSTFFNRVQGAVHCLSENFLDEAIREIGEEELLKYIRIE